MHIQSKVMQILWFVLGEDIKCINSQQY